MTVDLDAPILLVGGGKMGSALLKGWLHSGLKPKNLFVVEPDAERLAAFRLLGDVNLFDQIGGLPVGLKPAVLVIAIKPQNFDDVLPAYRALMSCSTLVVSIAAGRVIDSLEAIFGADQPIVRAMPNTPAAIGQAISVLCANGSVDERRRGIASALLVSVGEVIWIESEDLMHVVTGLSGGGPAYVFLLVESLARAGASLGLPDDLSMRLARATVQGSGALLAQSEQPASILRVEVTSPGGTTEAALKVLMGDHGLQELILSALKRAETRSRELA